MKELEFKNISPPQKLAKIAIFLNMHISSEIIKFLIMQNIIWRDSFL
jgi:hypothetical protein